MHSYRKERSTMVWFWIALYGIIYTLATHISRLAHPWFLPLAMLGYLGAFLCSVVRSGWASQLGVCVPRGICQARFLPLLLLPIYNLVADRGGLCPITEILLMVSTCAVEELFFRGFLLRTLRRYGRVIAVVLSSAAFALVHIVNLAAGIAPGFVLAQVLCAFTVGICYGIAAIETGSLLWGYVAHLLTNVTASPTAQTPTPLLWLCIAAYGGYGLRLLHLYHKKEKKHEAIY